MSLLGLAACRAGGAPAPQAQAQQVRPRFCNPADTAAAQPAGQLYSPRSLIIMYDGPRGKKSLLKAVKKYGARLMYDYTIINGMAIKINEGAKIEDAIEICEIAIQYGLSDNTKGGYASRLEKLKKKI